MDVDGGREWLTGGQQQADPVHRVKACDAFADDVHTFTLAGPPDAVLLAAAVDAECGDVVGEGVPPHVDHLTRITWDRDAPSTRAKGWAGNAEVLETVVEEREYFVALLGWVDR